MKNLIENSAETEEFGPTTTTAATTRGPQPTQVFTKPTSYRERPAEFRPSAPVIAPAPPTAEDTSAQVDYDQTTAPDLQRLKPVVRLKSPKLVGEATATYTEILGPTTIADCITDATTEAPPLPFASAVTTVVTETTAAGVTGHPFSSTFRTPSRVIKTGGQDKIRLRVGQ